MKRSRAGLTLVEVLMATVILGTVLLGLMQALSTCLSAFALARRVEALQAVLGQGEIAYPLVFEDDPVEELRVDEDRDLREGFTFARECDEDEDEDGLFVVRTRVVQGAGGPGSELTVVRYVYHEP